MSSEDISNYLLEIGNNQRKLQYTRQILSKNVNYVPKQIFSFAFSKPTNTITKHQFNVMIKKLALSITQEETDQIFSYFQSDDKAYVTQEQFIKILTPQDSTPLAKAVRKRKIEDGELTYEIKFGLHKLFFQILQNCIRLDHLCSFSFEENEENSVVQIKTKVTERDLKEFLFHHGKYPEDQTLIKILRQLSHNRYENSKNKSIISYIKLFNEGQTRGKHISLPRVIFNEQFFRKNTEISDSKLEKENTEKFVPSILPMQSEKSPIKMIKVFSEKDKKSELSTGNLDLVEQRIRQLMGQIHPQPIITTKPTYSSTKSPQKHCFNQTPYHQLQQHKQLEKSLIKFSPPKKLVFEQDNYIDNGKTQRFSSPNKTSFISHKPKYSDYQEYDVLKQMKMRNKELQKQIEREKLFNQQRRSKLELSLGDYLQTKR